MKVVGHDKNGQEIIEINGKYYRKNPRRDDKYVETYDEKMERYKKELERIRPPKGWRATTDGEGGLPMFVAINDPGNATIFFDRKKGDAQAVIWSDYLKAHTDSNGLPNKEVIDIAVKTMKWISYGQSLGLTSKWLKG